MTMEQSSGINEEQQVEVNKTLTDLGNNDKQIVLYNPLSIFNVHVGGIRKIIPETEPKTGPMYDSENICVHVVEQQSLEISDQQIVLYNPDSSSNDDVGSGKEIILRPEHEPRQCEQLVLPAVGAYTVQCAMCYKWRLIPSKGKYQEIREHIMDQPFICDLAREWRPDISCDDPGDVEQDGSRLWAIDKPSIAKPPPGWDRELRIRGQGGYNFADVYYTSPTGKRLRSNVQINKYLMKHPEFISEGVTMSQFSFKRPKPLQENYMNVRKPSVSFNASSGEPVQASPLLQASQDDVTSSKKKRCRPSKKKQLDALSDPQVQD